MFDWLFKRARQVMGFATGRQFAGFTYGIPRAGIMVDEYRSMNLSAVFACVRAISETIGYFPWHVYADRMGGGRVLMDDNPVDSIIDRRANPEMSAQTWREMMIAHALNWGSGFSEIERDATMRPLNLWPLPPDRTEPARNDDGNLVYTVNHESGQQYVIPAANVFHLRGLAWDGLAGYSAVRLGRESLGLTAAAERFGAAFFGNGARPGLAVIHEKTLSEAAIKNLRQSIQEAHGGADKAGGVMVLEEDMKLQHFAIPPEDAQFLETRQFQIEEICRWFRVPPHVISHLENAHYKNVTEESINFVKYTLLPWVRRLEIEANAKLFGRDGRRRLYTKMNVDALLRGDQESRARAYQLGIQYGWLSPNDARAFEDMDPIDDGDQHFVPANLMTLERAKMSAEIIRPESVVTDNEGNGNGQANDADRGRAGHARIY